MPVIIESNLNRYFHTTLYDDLGLEENVYTHIEWLGVESEADLCNYLGHIFNSKQAEMVARTLGFNLNLLRHFTESLINSKVPDLIKYLRCEVPEFAKEQAVFERKLNELYLVGETEHLLERGDLDFLIRDALQSFLAINGQAYAIDAIGEELRSQPIVQAMIDVGILYPEKHTVFITFANKSYQHFASQFLKATRLSGLKRLEYGLFRMKDGLHIKDLGMNSDRTPGFHYQKPHIWWDTDLYYRFVGRRPDPVKSEFPLDDPGRTTEVLMPKTLGTGNNLAQLIYIPILGYLSIIFKYPTKYMHKKEELLRQGIEKRAPAELFHRFVDLERHAHSDLPSWNAEMKLRLTKIEEHRAILRGLYIEEHPEAFAAHIKWRHVRRFIKDSEKTVKQHYFWQ